MADRDSSRHTAGRHQDRGEGRPNRRTKPWRGTGVCTESGEAERCVLNVSVGSGPDIQEASMRSVTDLAVGSKV